MSLPEENHKPPGFPITFPGTLVLYLLIFYSREPASSQIAYVFSETVNSYKFPGLNVSAYRV